MRHADLLEQAHQHPRVLVAMAGPTMRWSPVERQCPALRNRSGRPKMLAGSYVVDSSASSLIFAAAALAITQALLS